MKTKYVKPAFPYSHLKEVAKRDLDKTHLMNYLYTACTIKRSSGSIAESMFATWLVNTLPVTMIDEAGNLWIDLRSKDEHQTMFTAHIDTVHRSGGVNKVLADGHLWRSAEGSCLGADDGAGIALIAHMISEGVPALYVLFRGEEVGGIGSSWAAENMSETMYGIERCVSLDRAGYFDVITHQGGRCCSDTFANALANALTNEDMTLVFTPSAEGVFTDSANLVGLIPECTNLSVGYFNQHGENESLDVEFLKKLAAKLVKVDWDALPTERKIGEELDDAYAYVWPGAYHETH